jgi:putative endonuclease
MWCVYFLRLRDGSLYCGCSNDVARRLAAHASGRGSRVVRARLPFELVYVEVVPEGSRSAAQRREADLKRLTKKSKEALIVLQSQQQLKAERAASRIRR